MFERIPFTEGPWNYKKGRNGLYMVGSRETDFVICELFPQGGEEEANARLIAAAPEMLSSLHCARIHIQADLNTRILQPVERQSAELILKVVLGAIELAEG